MHQFLKEKEISRSISEVKVFHPWNQKYGNLFQIQPESEKHQYTDLQSVSVLILPVFRQLLQRNGSISIKYLFWNEGTQRADSRWQQQVYFTSISINFSIIYFQIGIAFHLKYYQEPNQVSLSKK